MPGLFLFILVFQTIYRIKTLGLSGIWTRIDGVEGWYTDHMTTTAALYFYKLI